VVAARANGHKVFLCTGRSMAELWDEILEPGFDGVIASAGGYVEYEGEVLLHRSIPVQEVRHVVDFFDRHGVEYLLESNGGTPHRGGTPPAGPARPRPPARTGRAPAAGTR
jgi:hydroxymethylpyrimidine pyrophosphatase-like HAD family hydrolase